MSESTTTRTTWRALAARQGRNDLPGVLALNSWRLTPDDLRAALAEAWTLPEWPEHHMDRESWVMLFDRAGFQVDGEPADVEALPEVVTLWRGATLDRRDGMSWTGRRESAEWFAQRFSGMTKDRGTCLFRIDIPREYVLARFNTRRGEDEYVVDTSSFEEDEYVIEKMFPNPKGEVTMQQTRRLRIIIEVDDEGGPDDYDRITDALSSIGASIVDETELPAEG